MADGKLLFLRPADGSGRLVFGDGDAGTVTPDAQVSVDAGFAGEGSAAVQLAVAVAASVDAGFAGDFGGGGELRWDANVSRGGLRHELGARWQLGVPVAVGMRSGWQQAVPLHVGSLARWQEAAPRRAGIVQGWRESDRLRGAALARWQQGDPRRAAVALHWQETERLRGALLGRWQQGGLRRAGVATYWQEMLRLRAAVATHWQDGRPAREAVASSWQPGRPVRVHLLPRWQEARRPPAGVSHLPPPPPVRPPCYDPARLGLLVFDTPYTGDGRLVFVCHRAGPGPDPEPPRFVIPLLRVYMAVHSISAVLLPSLERVKLDNVSITSDDDGYAWHLSASGPMHLMDQLAPVGGTPARVRVTIDGIQWVFAIEPPERSRRFGERQAQVRGSSVTALLGAPHMPERSWTSTVALTAQQIVAAALEFTGVTVDWGLSDWLVPAEAWSHQGSPLSVAQRVAEAAGAVLRSHRTDATLAFAPKYPHMPWAWPAAVPNVQMPGQIITQDTLQHIAAAQFNAVYVAGTTAGGVLGHVVRTGSAGDVLAPQITDPLITHEVAARQRGSAVLAAAAITKRQPITVPLLTGGTNPGLILPGYLIEVAEPGETWRGLVRGITITAGMPTVRQALSVERAL